ncbi:uncharacterized protein LOC131942699 [Physella acuta]|uniref:uncharacterized protein LOC131942699 n=1 Tax=Physella acuta TaxID=109671 RepID=UPI0027DD7F2C|nr:uncharacterized protein LOC131942699 [Physella acuta]
MKSVLELLKHFYIQRIIMYGIIAVFSFLVIVPLGDLRIRFTDDHCSRCILYSEMDFNVSETSDARYFRIRFGEQEVCEYSIAVSSVFCLIYPIAAALIYFYLYRRDNAERDENKLDLSHCLFLIHIAVEFAVVILMLVSASMISAGFMHFCQSVTVGVGSCIDAQNFSDWRGYDGSNFYEALAVATAGGWLLFVSWMFQGLLGLWKLWRLNVLPVLPCLSHPEE